MAEIFKDSFIVNDLTPDDCYIKAMEAAVKAMPDFELWKKRPIARLFGLKKKDDEFSTINFFLISIINGVEIQARFNTKDYSIEELKRMFYEFRNEMLKR